MRPCAEEEGDDDGVWLAREGEVGSGLGAESVPRVSCFAGGAMAGEQDWRDRIRVRSAGNQLDRGGQGRACQIPLATSC